MKEYNSSVQNSKQECYETIANEHRAHICNPDIHGGTIALLKLTTYQTKGCCPKKQQVELSLKRNNKNRDIKLPGRRTSFWVNDLLELRLTVLFK